MKTRNNVRQAACLNPSSPGSATRWMLVLLWVALLIATGAGNAENYSIGWAKIAGGGGTSTGGVYSVSGTIGQPDAGAMSGGNYTLQGGFWGLIAAVQTPGAAILSVVRTMTNTVVVSWPLPESGWKLHATTNLVTSGSIWSEIPPPYQTNGANLQFIELSPTGYKFYRLHKP